MLPEYVVIEDRAPDAVTATAATVPPVPEDDLSAEDLAALTALEQAYANRQQQVTPLACGCVYHAHCQSAAGAVIISLLYNTVNVESLNTIAIVCCCVHMIAIAPAAQESGIGGPSG